MEAEAVYEMEHWVVAQDSARNLGAAEDDAFPDVLATSRMIGLMELAAARLMQRVLGDGELSVGVGVDVSHLAATPLFQRVRARATYAGREGKLYRFRVELFDDGGRVGEGLHTRAVVTEDRLLRRATERIRAEAGWTVRL